jgi:hypothetical protein
MGDAFDVRVCVVVWGVCVGGRLAVTYSLAQLAEFLLVPSGLLGASSPPPPVDHPSSFWYPLMIVDCYGCVVVEACVRPLHNPCPLPLPARCVGAGASPRPCSHG